MSLSQQWSRIARPCDVWKDREKIEKHMTASNSLLAKKRCIVRDANFEKLDQACHVWFLQQCSNGAPLSGPLLRRWPSS